MRVELGSAVRCSDGAFGELADVVIDPLTRRVTHLVVRPTREDTAGSRLVPIDLTDPGGDGKAIALRCSVEEIERLESVQEVAFLRIGEFPVADPEWDIGIRSVLAAPYYNGGVDESFEPDTMIYDRVPKGEIEIRRTSPVFSSDGHHLGHVDGFVVGDDDAISHLVLERGHLWGKREISIPLGAIAKVETDEVQLSVTKDDVGDLPSVRVHRWH